MNSITLAVRAEGVKTITSVHFSYANQTVIIGVWLSNLEHKNNYIMGFTESIYTTVAISFDG